MDEVFIPETETTEVVDLSTPPDAYHLLGFTSSIDFSVFNKSTLNVGLDVSNIFNTEYRDYLNRLRYYADDLGLGLAVVGLVRLVSGLFDVFTDPLVGMMSAQHPGAITAHRMAGEVNPVGIDLIGDDRQMDQFHDKQSKKFNLVDKKTFSNYS